MLVFIKNTPKAYAWGSPDALPAILREAPTGEPQAELWLGDHSGAPAVVAKASREPQTLIDLIEADPAAYGVDGGPLPFLLKILGIGEPLSLQVHPNLRQAQAGFERENAEGVALDDPTRSYKDSNHKPELLVALEPTRALCGFRSIGDVRSDVSALTAAAGTCGAKGSQALFALAARLGSSVAGSASSAESARDEFLDWVFGGSAGVTQTVDAIGEVLERTRVPGLLPERRDVLREIIGRYPNDPGVLISLLLNLVELDPGEALFLGAGHLHAYLSGVGVEVMASSDNVLRAGLTPKHVDANELRNILDLSELAEPKFEATSAAPGLVAWEPPVADFALYRVCVAPQAEYDDDEVPVGSAETVSIDAGHSPSVLVATSGTIRVERETHSSREVANVRQGQSLYISAGQSVQFSGRGEAYLATVGVEQRAH